MGSGKKVTHDKKSLECKAARKKIKTQGEKGFDASPKTRALAEQLEKPVTRFRKALKFLGRRFRKSR